MAPRRPAPPGPRHCSPGAQPRAEPREERFDSTARGCYGSAVVRSSRPPDKKPRAGKPPVKKRPAARAALLTRTFDYEDGKHPVHVYLSGLGADSARVMGSALDSVADILSRGKIDAEGLAWHEIRGEHVSGLRGRLQKLYAPATANRYLTALRAVLKEAWRLGLVDREPMERALDVPTIRGGRELRGRAVLRDELRAVFATCADEANPPAGTRDAAILALLYGGGLRRAEVAGLALEQLDVAEGALHLQGKGNKERTVFLPSSAMRVLEAWLGIRGQAPGPLFGRVTRKGEVKIKPISAQLVYLIVQRRHLLAGIEPFTPHDLRRSFISDLLDEGIDLSTIARQVGHSSVQTTARYDRRDQRAQRAAAHRLEVPVSGKRKAAE